MCIQSANKLANDYPLPAASMTELENILWTSAVTIIGGVLVFTIGQTILKFLIEPVQELKKAIGAVRYNLAFHRPTIHTPASRTPERSEEAYVALQKSSCDLLTTLDAIPWYRFLSSICRRSLPSQRDIRDAATQLRGLSTYVHETGEKADGHINIINQRVEKIERCLNLKPLE